MGLSIVRRIVEKLGGEVGVQSKAGEGSTFYFSLRGVKSDGLPNGEPNESGNEMLDCQGDIEVEEAVAR